MSQLEVDKVIPQSGTTLTIGDSGDTITIASGATLSGDLNASNLSSGTVPDARITGDYTGLTSLTITRADNSNALSLVSTDADANAAPILSMRRESGSPADNDLIGQLDFIGKDSGGVNTQYASIKGIIKDVTNNTEDGALEFVTFKSGFLNNALTLGNTETVFNDASVDVDFRVESNANANMLFVDGGNNRVGIGTSAPTVPLMVQSNETQPLLLKGANDKQMVVETTGGSTQITSYQLKNSAYSWQIENGRSANTFTIRSSGGGERVRIDASGNFFVATTTEASDDVGHALLANGAAYHTADGTYPGLFNRKSSNGEVVQIRKDNTVVGKIGIETGGLTVDGEANHSGIIFSASSFLPRKNYSGADGTVDLGTTDGRWKDLYLGGGAFLGGTGTANKLDDYEEGSFTPSFSASGCSFNYTQRFGNYTKVGRVVHCKIFMRAQSSGSTSQDLKITGLPFTSSNTSGLFASCTFGQIYRVDLTDAERIVGQVSQNTTTIDLQYTVDDAASGNLIASTLDNSTSSGFIIDITYFTDA